MSEIEYSNAPWPVRESFAACHNRYWQRLAAPGNWFTGAERVNIARKSASRNIAICAADARKRYPLTRLTELMT